MGSLSSIQTTQQENPLDPNEPRIIATLYLPYTFVRDAKDRTKLKIVLSYQPPVFFPI